ncbi:aromatic amino acid ammonia-lyase [Leptospira sp. GIMC2001]|uniref:aromatic amino acid ammonia-lyase n=1 Tax=Leptospira sp. GIMC2001 TaxID=1513297 RepID=UPI0023496F35|nr:aromatic amino acid ammonia-lyase [Leptospira sp. GIMC2001]WCL50222.1 aromatic amino acid ammonia-lyase [Leptospira sp. GIMC2001]
MDSSDLYRIALGIKSYEQPKENRDRLGKSFAALVRHIESGGNLLYGVDTCFGPHAFSNQIDREELQRSLIYHLSVTSPGSDYLNHRESRSVLIARTHVLSLGYSGVSQDLIDLLIEMIDKDCIPKIPARGSLGASGDLIPLSAIGLCIMGEGVWLGEGDKSKISGIPRSLRPKEAISLTNGTSFMSGLLSYQLETAREYGNLILETIRLFTMMLPVYKDAFDPALSVCSPSQGLNRVCEYIYPSINARTKIDGVRIQDSYVIRAIPEILGCYFDNLDQLTSIIDLELNSVSDNPVYNESTDNFIEGALFYGSRISNAADQLCLSVVSLSLWLERLIQFILDPNENEGRLPLMLSLQPGRYAGLAGVGLLCTHLVAEMRRDSNPGSVQSIPTNGGNQNVVPMGGLSVVRNRRLMGDFRSLISCYLLTLRQMSFILKKEELFPNAFQSIPSTSKISHLARLLEISPILSDKSLGSEIGLIDGWLQEGVFFLR